MNADYLGSPPSRAAGPRCYVRPASNRLKAERRTLGKMNNDSQFGLTSAVYRIPPNAKPGAGFGRVETFSSWRKRRRADPKGWAPVTRINLHPPRTDPNRNYMTPRDDQPPMLLADDRVLILSTTDRRSGTRGVYGQNGLESSVDQQTDGERGSRGFLG